MLELRALNLKKLRELAYQPARTTELEFVLSLSPSFREIPDAREISDEGGI
jgi:hypothetical protein